MKRLRKRKALVKFIAYFFCTNFLFQILCPTIGYALNSGPSSPEFSSFEPVATTDMVNTFTGDFTYNIPVVNVPGPGGGYPLSLSYHSGNSSEQDASWVGFGWTLNPGAINRNVRGVPDEYNGTKIDYYNKNYPNWTVSGGVFGSFEAMSNSSNSKSNKDKGSLKKHSPHGLNMGYNVRYNNYQGYNGSAFIGATFKGYGSLGLQASPSGVTFSADIDVQSILTKGFRAAGKKMSDKKAKRDANSQETTKSSPQKKAKNSKKLINKVGKFVKSIQPTFGIINVSAGSDYGLLSFAEFPPNMPTAASRGFGFNLNVSQLAALSTNVGFEYGLKGGYFMHYNKPFVSRDSYGFMNNLAEPSDDVVGDYYVEKESSWDKRDLYLGMPFSTPDLFNLNGEGLGGSFRLHNTQPGHFYPTFNKGRKLVFNLGAELQLGAAVGIGLNIGAGYQETVVKKWGQYDDGASVPYQVNGGTVMRFTGDPSSSVTYGNNNLITAKVYKKPKAPGIAGGHLDFGGMNLGESSMNKYETSSKIDFDQDLLHFNITNKDGIKYSYGKKVNENGSTTGATSMVRNEGSLNVKATGQNDGFFTSGNLSLGREGTSFKVEHCHHDVLNGQIKTTPYANTYMLGEILAPTYVDVTGNGPTDDDFGGWTKFEYFKNSGDNNDNGNSLWYNWRIPFSNMFFEENSISEEKDDLGSVTFGEKEIFYLKKIETRTHVAYFVTNNSFPQRFGANASSIPYLNGSLKERNDGKGAVLILGESVPRSTEYLEKIVLFSKNRPEKPLQTTHFEYSYSIGGKLTLERIWSDYEGVSNAKISPYEFNYLYKKKEDYPGELLSNYNNELGEFFNLSNTYSYSSQNPAYNPHLLGPWGFTQPMGIDQHKKQRDWIYQGKLLRNADYDPAAWQLKRIKLPSGGELLVEYESKDYSYLQDRRPMAMVSIKAHNEGSEPYKKNPYYIINLKDVGIEEEDEDYQEKTQALVEYFRDYYLEKKNRIYFKFLYALLGLNPDLNNCRSEYITGYVKVSSVEFVSGEGIKITLDGSGSAYDKNKAGYSMVPRQGCYDFYSTQRVGKINVVDCERKAENTFGSQSMGFLKSKENCGGGDSKNDFIWPGFVGKFFEFSKKLGSFIETMVTSPPIPPLKKIVCLTFNKDLSYLKIPILQPKRGGGMRVKRLLMYDPGLENGDAMIYGKRYHYVNEEGESSGVATNEPGSMREENALVGFLPKKHQSWFGRLTVGKDKEQSEGPLGEFLLPSASIGYSRVIEENVHTGKTAAGFTVHHFNTVKDYPFDGVYSSNGKRGKFDSSFKNGMPGVQYSDLQSNTKKDLMNLSLCKGGIVFGYKSKKIWAAQGFRFVQNDMHGKPKSVKIYGGTLPSDFKIDEGNAFIAGGQEYEYFEPGEKIPMMSNSGEISWELPAKEMDVTMDMRSVKDWGLDLAIALDFSISTTLTPPVMVSFAGANIGYNEKILSSHSTTKVIKYHSTVKKVTTYKDGIANVVENLGFDKATGETLLTASKDIFDGINNEETTGAINGKTYQFKLPAHWFYGNFKFTNRLTESVGSIMSFGDGGEILSGAGWVYPQEIISANVQTYGYYTPYNDPDSDMESVDWFPYAVTRDYGEALGNVGSIARPLAQYTYDALPTNRLLTDQGSKKLFEEGIIQNFQPFDFTPYANNSDWLMLNKITKYSPHGNPLEDQDVEGIYSAAKYGYDGTLMTMRATNAKYEEIYFNSYEDEVTPKHHAGKGALAFKERSGGFWQTILSGIYPTSHLFEKGGIFKCWLYDPHDEHDFKLNFKVNYSLSSSSSNWKTPRTVVKVGEWVLKELYLSPEDFASLFNSVLNRGTANRSSFNDPGGGFEDYFEDVTIDVIGEVSSEAFVDDAKFQPMDATAGCYVYDPGSLRLVAQFDDPHFGLYYQYNNEGKLVRKLIETERGMKTVEETQYNAPLVKK